MKIEIDTHSHTLASGHAYCTIHEMARTAAQKGLKGLAITEHAPEMPGSTHLFYFQNLRVVPRQMDGIELLLGTELNIMDEEGNVDLPEKTITQMDLVIASMHLPCYHGEKTKEAVTKAYIHAMENPHIDIIGHPDDGRFPVDYEELAKAAKRTGTLLELNNSSLKPGGFRENTMVNALEMLKYCKEYQVKIVVATDSHVDTTIAELQYVEQALEQAEFPEELVVNRTLDGLKSSIKKHFNKMQ